MLVRWHFHVSTLRTPRADHRRILSDGQWEVHLAAIASSICALHEVPRTAFGPADPAADHIVGMGPGQASTAVKSWVAKGRQIPARACPAAPTEHRSLAPAHGQRLAMIRGSTQACRKDTEPLPFE